VGGVRLEVAADDDEVFFRVIDTGPGIPPEQLDRIFDPFWQAEGGLTRRMGGTGLGLSVAHRLTELLGGELSVSSEVGEGSTFSISLPLRPSLPRR
jgi:signal transduction histidine kinase